MLLGSATGRGQKGRLAVAPTRDRGTGVSQARSSRAGLCHLDLPGVNSKDRRSVSQPGPDLIGRAVGKVGMPDVPDMPGRQSATRYTHVRGNQMWRWLWLG